MAGIVMLDSKRRIEIREKAENIEQESERYQLVHATYACQSLIRETVEDFYKKEYDSVRKKMLERIVKKLDVSEQEKEIRELEGKLKKIGFHVDVVYIDMMSEEEARVVKIENAFVIYLPKSLGNKIIDTEGKFNYEIIRKVRKMMAHELGHLVLHTDDLMHINGTQGSKEIINEEKEAEADYFGKELLDLRRKRNEKITIDGGASNLF